MGIMIKNREIRLMSAASTIQHHPRSAFLNSIPSFANIQNQKANVTREHPSFRIKTLRSDNHLTLFDIQVKHRQANLKTSRRGNGILHILNGGSKAVADSVVKKENSKYHPLVSDHYHTLRRILGYRENATGLDGSEYRIVK